MPPPDVDDERALFEPSSLRADAAWRAPLAPPRPVDGARAVRAPSPCAVAAPLLVRPSPGGASAGSVSRSEGASIVPPQNALETTVSCLVLKANLSLGRLARARAHTRLTS